MTKTVQLNRVIELDENQIAHLIEESLAQGFRFVERLVIEYQNGTNRFDQPGEILLTASVQDRVIGIGGLNRDRYLNHPKIGRLRHLYIASNDRNQGIGNLLVTQLIQAAQPHYQLLTLRTDTANADRFYQSLGFKTEPKLDHATHHLQLDHSKNLLQDLGATNS